MPSVMPSPMFQVLDANGNPVSGAKIYAYDAGTSTPRTTYADALGLETNANPVITDSSGRAKIYWSGTYKIVVTDADGNTLYTVDDVKEPLDEETTLGEWVETGLAPTYISGTSFSVAGDQRTELHVGKRLKLHTAVQGYLYGIITASAYSSVTTITVALDSGSLDSSLDSLAKGFISSTPSSIATPFAASLLRAVNLAAYRAIVADIPTGSKMLFYANTAPTGWTRDTNTAFNDKPVFSTGDGTGGATGGNTWAIAGLTADSHTHTGTIAGFTLGSTASTQGITAGSDANVPNTAHTHQVNISHTTDGSGSTGVSSAGTWRPPYSSWIVCTKD